MEAAVHEDYFFGVSADVAASDGVVDVGVDPVAGSVAGVVSNRVVEVVGGLVCPVSFVVKARVDVDIRVVGAFGSAVSWCAAVGGEGIAEGDHFFALVRVGGMGHGEACGEGDESGGDFGFYVFHIFSPWVGDVYRVHFCA